MRGKIAYLKLANHESASRKKLLTLELEWFGLVSLFNGISIPLS